MLGVGGEGCSSPGPPQEEDGGAGGEGCCLLSTLHLGLVLLSQSHAHSKALSPDWMSSFCKSSTYLPQQQTA